MMKKLLALLTILALALTGAALAEADGNAMYSRILADEGLRAEYPYCAFIDVNGDGAPVLVLSTTREAFIGAEDRAIVYAGSNDGKQVMELGGAGGEKLYLSADEHTLTHFSRLSGEGHLEVFRLNGDALEPVTQIDHYGPHHAPDVDNAAEIYRQDGAEIDEATFSALWEKYASEDDAVTYAPLNAAGEAAVEPGNYYTFEGTAVAMRIPAEFLQTDSEPAEDVYFEGRSADVFLQVSAVDGDFADRDALMEYYNGLDYVVRATQLEINGVELVYAEGADDNAMVYAVISPEGTTYQFVFLPQNEKGVAMVEAITQSICPSDAVPQ